MLLYAPDAYSTPRLADTAWSIASALVRAAMYEASCHGKPGLVCPDTPGVHMDMDYATFMTAIPALIKPFTLSAQMGVATRERHGGIQKLFAKLRRQGPDWEQGLMHTTRGVNTHRGLLFLGCVTAAAAGVVGEAGSSINARQTCETVAAMCTGLCGRELSDMPDNPVQTAGRRLYCGHGLRGIRGEAEAGLPGVIDHALPALREALAHGAGLEWSLLHALIALMTVTEDTTVANRAGLDGLRWMRRTCAAIRNAGGMLTIKGRTHFFSFRDACLQRNVSPGGAADLLSLTVALHELERGQLSQTRIRGDRHEHH